MSKTGKITAERLAVCSWSLQPATPAQLIEQLREVGLARVQLDLDPLREQPALWQAAPEMLAQAGLQCVSGMFRTVGEDYTTLESIRRTGGVVPDHTWEQNWQNLQITVRNAQALKLPYVMFHAGFLPHDPADPDFRKMLGRIRQIARLFADHGIGLLFETGQETAESLKSFLEHLAEPNVGVNFDPANMILYNNGDPLQALRVIGGYVKSCHLKDARRTRTPGTWGDEVVMGEGEVNWPEFFGLLGGLGFSGYCCLEREAGNQRLQDLRAGRLLAEKVLGSGV